MRKRTVTTRYCPLKSSRECGADGELAAHMDCMTTFDENDHPRQPTGKFTEKSHSESSVGLTDSVGSLTPYDTGARMEPKLWVGKNQKPTNTADLDRFGRVDFENDEGASMVTVYVEPGEDGQVNVHIVPLASDESEINVIFD